MFGFGSEEAVDSPARSGSVCIDRELGMDINVIAKLKQMRRYGARAEVVVFLKAREGEEE
jgi:hypothetical protein